MDTPLNEAALLFFVTFAIPTIHCRLASFGSGGYPNRFVALQQNMPEKQPNTPESTTSNVSFALPFQGSSKESASREHQTRTPTKMDALDIKNGLWPILRSIQRGKRDNSSLSDFSASRSTTVIPKPMTKPNKIGAISIESAIKCLTIIH
jgi:hypothetical protein